MKTGIVLIISAPSGAGKSTICNALQKRLPNLKVSVSHTTRKSRPGEKDGKDYIFIEESKFRKMIEDGKFLEWAKVHNNYYGTAFSTITKNQQCGQTILLELDVQGAEILRKIRFDGVFIMILPPSIEDLSIRLNKRSTETSGEIEMRINTGKSEITHYRIYDYIVTNSDVAESVQTIMAILKAEESRSARYIPTSNDIKEIFTNN